MKRAILRRFLIVLVMALLISGAISGIMISDIMLKNTENNMRSLLELLDPALDYGGNLQAQIDDIQEYLTTEEMRFTIMKRDGVVMADNSVQNITNLENHKERKECAEALINGIGYAERYSDTLKRMMLYVARISNDGQYILRISVPFRHGKDYFVLLAPSLAISFCVSIILAVILAARFARTISRPLREISEQMKKIREENQEISFSEYEYEELNVIANTTAHLSQEVNEYMKKMDLERTIRQEFFSNASHELKTPITSIQGYAELLENDMIPDESMQKELLSRIRKEAENMTGLINDILMISKLETKEAQVTMCQVRIVPLISDIVEGLKPLAQVDGICLNWRSEPISIQANPQQIKELITNLVTNAIKYNRSKGSVEIIARQMGGEMELIVSDTGVGILKEDLNRIFERFYRVDKGRNKNAVSGTGLGLSIVKHIVSYYNGTITVTSVPDKGSTFLVRLPIMREKEKTDRM